LPAPEHRESMPDDWQVAGMVDAMLRLSELNSTIEYL
jgi:hypothetical protein